MDLTGYLEAAWRYVTRAGVFGRLYARTCGRALWAERDVGLMLDVVVGLDRFSGVDVVRSARSAGCGVMSIVHRREPVGSHIPRRTGWPWALVMTRPVLVKVAMQSELQSLPILMRLLVKLGTMWSVRACDEGRGCRVS